MPVRTRRLPRTAARSVAAATGLVLLLPTSAAAEPDYEAPFGCGQNWWASTRSYHSPSVYSVDFNRDDDYRAPVLAAAPGLVTAVVDVGGTSYGKYVIVDHGRNRSSLYAHLDAQWVVPGQWVDQGAYIGLLGTSGGSTGPHLHFEERVRGVNQRARFHGRRLNYDSTINSFNCGDVPVSGDWNADGRTDIGVWRPGADRSKFRLRRSDGTVREVRFGRRTDRPVTGDWDGNGGTDVGVWNRRKTRFVLRQPGGGARRVDFGGRRDLPITGDWNGNGRTDLGTYRPGNRTVRLRGPAGRISRFHFGAHGSVPATGDFDGDGRTDLAAFDVRTGTWKLRFSRTGRVRTSTFGRVGSLPVTGDWNGDGTDSLGTWRPGSALFRQQRNATVSKIRFGLERR